MMKSKQHDEDYTVETMTNAVLKVLDRLGLQSFRDYKKLPYDRRPLGSTMFNIWSIMFNSWSNGVTDCFSEVCCSSDCVKTRRVKCRFAKFNVF
jgi:hypothetical protein